MAGIDPNKNITLRRTAKEIKNYRVSTKVLRAAAALLAMLVIIVYVIAVMYNKYGSFTVTVNKFDNVKYGLSLSETPEFFTPTMRLNSKASEEITNISVNDLPDDLDSQNGEHNGKNYVAYSFYMKNTGTETVDCEYTVKIANQTTGIENAVRVRLYVNGEYTDYARTKNDGSGPEPGTTEFYDPQTVVKKRIHGFESGEITKFTVVIWLEGDDPECVDNIIGGQFKIDMYINILNIDIVNPEQTGQ
ncbi:MAG: hypothetical protein ACI3XL_01605 [Eubacteriales bacterium]